MSSERSSTTLSRRLACRVLCSQQSPLGRHLLQASMLHETLFFPALYSRDTSFRTVVDLSSSYAFSSIQLLEA